MRRIVIARTGGPSRLKLVETPDPVAGPGQVLIANEATGIAFADVLMREGLYPGVKVPFTPGYEVVGRVLATGAGVVGPEPGARIAALTVTGGYATHALVDARWCVPVPDALPSVVAAALVLNGLTAWQMLTRMAPLSPGASVLAWGAAGGVGSLSIDLGRHLGLAMLGIASGERTARVAAQGAHAINRKGDVAAQVRAIAADGVDLVLDGVGGRTSAQSFDLLRPGGTLVLFGFQGGMSRGRKGLTLLREYFGAPRWGAQQILLSGRGVKGYLVTDFNYANPGLYREDLARLFDLAVTGAIVPAIDHTYPLAEAAQAHRRMNSGDVAGKLVLLPA